jgi:MFS family permease
MIPTPPSLPAGMTIAAIFGGQSLGMAGIVSFPALLPQFRQLWSLSGSEAGLISGIYFAGYIVAVPVLSALTDRLDPRRIYVLSLLGGAMTALGFAAFADGAASAALWRFLQGAAFGGAHMPGMRALCDAVPAERQTRSVAVYTSSFTVGVSLSYALSGALAEAFGWRSGFALLAAGPLAAAAIARLVLPPPSRASATVSSWLPPLGSIFRNRRALVFICAYGLHNGEVSAIRAWLVALLVFAADRAGRQDLTGYATLVATIANLCGTPLIVAVNELAARWERHAVVATTMVASATAGVLLAVCRGARGDFCCRRRHRRCGHDQRWPRRRERTRAPRRLSCRSGGFRVWRVGRHTDPVRADSGPCRWRRERSGVDRRFCGPSDHRCRLALRLSAQPCSPPARNVAARWIIRLWRFGRGLA